MACPACRRRATLPAIACWRFPMNTGFIRSQALQNQTLSCSLLTASLIITTQNSGTDVKMHVLQKDAGLIQSLDILEHLASASNGTWARSRCSRPEGSLLLPRPMCLPQMRLQLQKGRFS